MQRLATNQSNLLGLTVIFLVLERLKFLHNLVSLLGNALWRRSSERHGVRARVTTACLFLSSLLDQLLFIQLTLLDQLTLWT